MSIQVMVNADYSDMDLPPLGTRNRPNGYVGCKAPMFSFTRLRGADPKLGVEMASTGEVACFGADKHEAFLKRLVKRDFRYTAAAAAAAAAAD
jgi:carbamoyl-phosphate synthase (ammonia)